MVISVSTVESVASFVPDMSLLDGLSARERAVLDLVALGRTNVGIARTLNISSRTVAKHLEHSYRKLQVANRAAAVAVLCSERPDIHAIVVGPA